MDRDERGVDAPVRRDAQRVDEPSRIVVEVGRHDDEAVQTVQPRADIAVVVVGRLGRFEGVEPFDRNFVRLRQASRRRMCVAARVRARRLAAGRAQCLHRMLQLVQRRTQHVHEHEQDRDQVAVARSHGVAGIRGGEGRESSARRKGGGGGEELGCGVRWGV